MNVPALAGPNHAPPASLTSRAAGTQAPDGYQGSVDPQQPAAAQRPVFNFSVNSLKSAAQGALLSSIPLFGIKHLAKGLIQSSQPGEGTSGLASMLGRYALATVVNVACTCGVFLMGPVALLPAAVMGAYGWGRGEAREAALGQQRPTTSTATGPGERTYQEALSHLALHPEKEARIASLKALTGAGLEVVGGQLANIKLDQEHFSLLTREGALVDLSASGLKHVPYFLTGEGTAPPHAQGLRQHVMEDGANLRTAHTVNRGPQGIGPGARAAQAANAYEAIQRGEPIVYGKDWVRFGIHCPPDELGANLDACQEEADRLIEGAGALVRGGGLHEQDRQNLLEVTNGKLAAGDPDFTAQVLDWLNESHQAGYSADSHGRALSQLATHDFKQHPGERLSQLIPRHGLEGAVSAVQHLESISVANPELEEPCLRLLAAGTDGRQLVGDLTLLAGLREPGRDRMSEYLSVLEPMARRGEGQQAGEVFLALSQASPDASSFEAMRGRFERQCALGTPASLALEMLLPAPARTQEAPNLAGYPVESWLPEEAGSARAHLTEQVHRGAPAAYFERFSQVAPLLGNLAETTRASTLLSQLSPELAQRHVDSLTQLSSVGSRDGLLQDYLTVLSTRPHEETLEQATADFARLAGGLRAMNRGSEVKGALSFLRQRAEDKPLGALTDRYLKLALMESDPGRLQAQFQDEQSAGAAVHHTSSHVAVGGVRIRRRA